MVNANILRAVPVFVLLLGGAACAQDELLLQDGEVVSGRVVEVRELAVVIDIPGEGVREVPLATLEPAHAYYLLEERVPRDGSGDEAAARVSLGTWCLDEALHAFAERQFERAIDLDLDVEGEAREGLAAAREGLAREVYLEAQEAAGTGRATLLEELTNRFPTSEAASWAREDLAEIRLLETRRANREAEREKARQELAARRARLLEDYLARAFDEAVRRSNDAADQRNYARGRKLATEADKKFLALVPYVRELDKYDSRAAADWRGRIERKLVDLYNMLAVIDIEQQNSRGAQYWISQALLLDPENERAKDLRDVNISYGIEMDPFRMPIGELARRIDRGSVSGYMVRAFLRRTGSAGVDFLQGRGRITAQQAADLRARIPK